MKNILNLEKIDELFQANWVDLLDRMTFMRILLEDVRNSDYQIREGTNKVPLSTRLTITKFIPCGKCKFEVWVEFTVPKNEGVVQGSHIYCLNLDGSLELKNTYGVHFVTKK